MSTKEKPLRVLTGAPPPWKTRWSRPLGRVIDHVVYTTTVTGREHIPTGGPVVFAANHLSYLDGPVMVGASNRYMHVMVRHDMFKGILGRVLHASGQIPVNRDGDRAALQYAKAVLDRGDCVGILPEGTRGSGHAATVSSGVAWLALNSVAAVVPVAILGTRRSGEHRNKIPAPRRKLHVVFGEPLMITREPGVSGRVSMDRATEQIRLRLAGHIAAAQTATGQDLPADDDLSSKHKGQQP
ncbi:1-acyl-sn-glycerol-3-phosphate acyltransferase [Arthrobacter sp. PAMC 25486]|uniref:lysophospholipid acyltransferase family protein n=1 Tax=Arthrobacter sp. PAMC 25486 TaxID=1494608 RepID=UPI0009DF85F5|nr:lysophospholipid acyltransferase family protein [Arthrobacter sp. PAMC 25486]